MRWRFEPRLVLLALAVVVLASASAGAADWRSIVPVEYASKISMQAGSKALTYYRLTAEEPLTFAVEGPTRVKILTRLRMANPLDQAVYSVEISRDGALDTAEELATVPSSEAFYIEFSNFRPGAIRRIYIDVPTGAHSYVLRPVGPAAVDARVFVSTRKKAARVSVAPSRYHSVETCLYKEKELTYYVATKAEPVVLDIVGPTTLKVNTRLVFDDTMLREQTYVLGVREEGVPECLYRIESVPSKTVACRDRVDRTPGALRHFMLEVGEGPHTFEFRLVDAESEALALKFYIPRGDVQNGS